jgi:NAD(P)-dependent dehydrogenase (short-subunit alcohol dehydrogenase family)
MVDEDDALWTKNLSVNAFGTGKMTRAAVKQFLKQEVDPVWGSRGRVVSVTSVAGVVAFPGEAAYSASKAAVGHLMRAAAMDHAKDSINFNSVAPGCVHTGMARVNFESQNVLKLMQNATPWPRMGEAEDIASAIVFFCLPQSQWVTGQELAVDGGLSMGVAPPKV